MKALRYAQTLLVFAVGFLFALILFNNLTDANTNLVYIAHVLKMDLLPPDHGCLWRALHHPAFVALFFGTIVIWELIVTVLCLAGSFRLWRKRAASRAEYMQAKSAPVLGLALGFALIVMAFVAVGGEWFYLWLAPAPWSGALDNATRLCIVTGVALVVLVQPGE